MHRRPYVISEFDTIWFIEGANSSIFAHKMRKSTDFGARFLLL